MPSTPRLRWVIVLCGVLMATSAGATEVASCGQVLGPGDVGVVQGDLVCAGGPAVRLENGAVLDLGGHTLTLKNGANRTVIECQARCSVLGPGRLVTDEAFSFGAGIVSDGKGRIRVTGVDLEGFTVGIESPGARVSLTDTTMQGILAIGADVRRLDVDGVTITLLGTGTCISAFTSRVIGKQLTLSGCDSGIIADRSVSLTGLTSSGAGVGVLAKRVKLVDSSVTGSTLADIASGRFPRLINTSCDRSAQLDSSGVMTATSWAVCAND